MAFTVTRLSTGPTLLLYEPRGDIDSLAPRQRRSVRKWPQSLKARRDHLGRPQEFNQRDLGTNETDADAGQGVGVSCQGRGAHESVLSDPHRAGLVGVSRAGAAVLQLRLRFCGSRS